MTETLQPTGESHSALADREGDGPLCFRLQRELIDPEVLARVSVEGEPVSKQRPRLGRRGAVYTPGPTRAAENKVAWAYRLAMGPSEPDSTGTFGVFIGFFSAAGWRRDVDNLTKLVLDALNGVAWADDSQVSEISAKVARWQDEPRTEIVIYRTVCSEHPSAVCETCDQRFPVYPSQRGRRFCSTECRRLGRTVQKACPRCATKFSVKKNRAELITHCSDECRRANERDELTQLTCEFCQQSYARRPSEIARRRSRFCSAECRRAGTPRRSR